MTAVGVKLEQPQTDQSIEGQDPYRVRSLEGFDPRYEVLNQLDFFSFSFFFFLFLMRLLERAIFTFSLEVSNKVM